jgi:flagellar basal body rod protein FlgB
MKIEKDLSHIANAIALANANGNKVSAQFADLQADLQEEIANEEFTLEHGIQHASERDIEDEFVSLDAVESDKDDDDFDNDENLVDMSQVSGSLREIFGE